MFTDGHRKDWTIVSLILLAAFCTQALAGTFAGGTGEPNDPYRIATAAQLTAIGADPNLLNKHYELVADIDLMGISFPHAPIAFDTDETKADFQGTSFSGSFDGNGHKIYNLTIGGSGYLGLFGRVSNGIILDLALEDVAVLGIGSCIGGLAGYNYLGWVTNCYTTGSVAGASSVGGLVGWVDSGTLTNCYSTCFLSGGSRSGGLVGYNVSGLLFHCYSSGLVIGAYPYGGLVGSSSGTTVNCFWDTQTSGQTSSGSGTGKTTALMQTSATFLTVGWDFRDESANGLAQTWQMPDEGGYPVLSLFHGYTPATLTGSGSAVEPYRVATAADLATVHHQPGACYKLTATVDLSQAKWSLPVVPVFFGTLDGDGHSVQHLTIKGGTYLGLFGVLLNGGQIENLGVEDANIVGTSYVGGLIGSNAGNVTKCFSTGKLTGTSSTGGLVGSNGGTIANCYNAASVAGSSYAGGLTGYNNGRLSKCYSTGLVTGTSSVGGLVGYKTYSGSDAGCFWDVVVSGRTSSGGGLGLSTGMLKRMQTYLLFGWDFIGETTNGTEDIWWIDEGKDYPCLWWQAAKK